MRGDAEEAGEFFGHVALIAEAAFGGDLGDGEIRASEQAAGAVETDAFHVSEGAHVESALEDTFEGADGGASLSGEVGDGDAAGVVLLHKINDLGEFGVGTDGATGGFEFTGHTLEPDDRAGGVVEGEFGGGIPADGEIVVGDEFDFVENRLTGGHDGFVVVLVSFGKERGDEFEIGETDNFILVRATDHADQGIVRSDESAGAVFYEIADVVKVFEEAESMRGGRRWCGLRGGSAARDAARGAGER